MGILGLTLFILGSLLAMSLILFPRDDHFQIYLSQLDLAIEKGKLEEVEKLFNKTSSYAKWPRQWRSLLKRAYLLGRDSGDYGFYLAMARKALEKYGGKGDFNAIYTSALLWNGNYRGAADTLDKIPHPQYKSLVAEAFLSFRIWEEYSLGDYSPLEFIKEKIQFKEEPGFFGTVGSLTGNPAISYNGALLYMEEGNRQKAKEILLSLDKSRLSPYKLAVPYYDLGLYPEARNAFQAQVYLNEISDTPSHLVYLYLANLEHMAGEKAAALLSYTKALEADPRGNWKTYQSLARLYLDVGYSRRSRETFLAGMENFPNEFALLEDYVSFFNQEEPIEAQRMLVKYEEEHPGDNNAQLLRMRVYSGDTSLQERQRILWELFNEDSSNPKVTRTLLWYLGGIDDLEGMEIVLERNLRNGPLQDWHHFYYAIIQMKREEFNLARISTQKAYELRPSWINSHNYAMMEWAVQNWDFALELLEEAYRTLEGRAILRDKGIYLSQILYKKARILEEQGRIEEASEALVLSLEKDPENIQAGSLYRRLKEANDKIEE